MLCCWILSNKSEPSTSPSIYVRFPAVSARDNCGPTGPTLISRTLAFSPGDLSTVRGYPNHPTPFPLDTADLPCGPEEASGHGHPLDGSYADMVKQIQDMNAHKSEYRPYVQLPQALFDLAPTWSWCNPDYGAGQDPPRALKPGVEMAPPPVLITTEVSMQHSASAAPSRSTQQIPSETGSQLPPNAGSIPPEDHPPIGLPHTNDDAQSDSDYQTQSGNAVASKTPGPVTEAPTSRSLPRTSDGGSTILNQDGYYGSPDAHAGDALDSLALEPNRGEGLDGVTKTAAHTITGQMAATPQFGVSDIGSQTQNIPLNSKQGHGPAEPVVNGGVRTSPSLSLTSRLGYQHLQSASDALGDQDPGIDITSYEYAPILSTTSGGEIDITLSNDLQNIAQTLEIGHSAIRIDQTHPALYPTKSRTGSVAGLNPSPLTNVATQQSDFTIENLIIASGASRIVVDGSTITQDPASVDETLALIGPSMSGTGSGTDGAVPSISNAAASVDDTERIENVHPSRMSGSAGFSTATPFNSTNGSGIPSFQNGSELYSGDATEKLIFVGRWYIVMLMVLGLCLLNM